MEEYTFANQRPTEDVILVQKQHPWILFRLGLLAILLVVINIITFMFFGASLGAVIVLVLSVVVALFYSFKELYLYRNVFFILTNERIINIDQSSIFGRKIQETELINIYNLSYSMKGIARNLLNFGNIELTTEGDATDRIVFRNVPDPHNVFEKLSSARKAAVDKEEHKLNFVRQKILR